MSNPDLDPLADLDLVSIEELDAALAEDNGGEMDVFSPTAVTSVHVDDDITWLVSQLDGTAPPPTALSASPTYAVPPTLPPLLAPQTAVAAPAPSAAPPAFLTATGGVTSPIARRTASSKRKAPEISGCTCKKTRCLKKYCECYRVGNKCDPSVCRCRDCSNTKDRVVEQATLQGCTCRRNKCLKKYCECYRSKVRCDPSKCSCLGCGNRDPSAATGRVTQV